LRGDGIIRALTHHRINPQMALLGGSGDFWSWGLVKGVGHCWVCLFEGHILWLTLLPLLMSLSLLPGNHEMSNFALTPLSTVMYYLNKAQKQWSQLWTETLETVSQNKTFLL
jgi:hypothetical protein